MYYIDKYFQIDHMSLHHKGRGCYLQSLHQRDQLIDYKSSHSHPSNF